MPRGEPNFSDRGYTRRKKSNSEEQYIVEEYPSKERVQQRHRNRPGGAGRGFDTYHEDDRQSDEESPRSDEGKGWQRGNKEEKYSSDDRRESRYERDYRNELRSADGKKSDWYSSDRDALDQTATKIQTAVRGYLTRKKYLKNMELDRRRSLENSKNYRQEEYTIASVTSVVDGSSVSGLATNADPNLGLTTVLPDLDSSQRHDIIRELKSTLNFAEDISTVSQLQTEASPTIITLGGINPLQADNFILGASMFVYNIQKDKWFFGGTIPEPRNYHTAGYLNGKIYVIGGYNPLEINNHQMVATACTFQLSVRSKRWRKRSDMHRARACHGMCIVNDNIVVMGGHDASGKLLSSVEMYYPQKDQWVLLKSIPQAIMGFSCVVLYGHIYIIGGIVNGEHNSGYAVSNRVFAFDFEKQIWYRAEKLPEPRAFASAATLNGEIWLWGGVKDVLNEDGFLLSTNSVFVYNPDFLNWKQHLNVGTVKHAAAIVKCGRRVYILGGMSNTGGLKDVLNENDYYNRELDKYMEGASLPRPLAGCAAVALPIDYISSSDPKWNAENINDDVMNEAATKIQSVFRGYISRSKFPFVSSSYNAVNSSYRNTVVMRASTEDPYGDKFKAFQRVQIEDWPPAQDPQISTSDISLRYGTLPRGYTITTMNDETLVKRYALLPPHADPNLSMIGHLCNAYKRAKTILGLRKVDNLPSFTTNLINAPTLQDDCLPVILIMGGLQPKDPINLSYGKLMLRYHVLKNRFEYFGALPEPRNYHAAVYYRENIYVSGGCDPDNRNSGEMVATNTMYCLNIHSNDWVEKAEMICSRAYHNLVVALGKIFAVGGRNNNGRLVASIEAYDVENDNWSLLRPMPGPRMGMACAVVDDHIWCLGGLGSSDSPDTSYSVLRSVLSYDIGKDVWVNRPSLRCPRAFGSCVMVHGNMWLVGGASYDPKNEVLISIASVDKYSFSSAQWTRKTIISNPRHSAAVVSVDSNIYIFGGISSQEWSPLARNEMIGVSDLSLHTAKPLPVPLTGIAAVAVPPILPSLRAESLAMLLHTRLTYH